MSGVARAREAWAHRPELARFPRGWSLLAAGAAGGALAFLLARRDARESWRGRVALVTGGTRGFGLLLARELLAEGCSVAICARDEGELERAREDLRRFGGDVLAVRCDVTDQEQVERMVSRVLASFGRIDVLVNNAGTIEVGPIEGFEVEDFRRAHAVIFGGAVHCVLAVLPHMLARGEGNVINVSSIGGRLPVPHLLPYDSAKLALTGFSEGLRAELAPHGICVTSVFPGTMRTGSYRKALFQGRQDEEHAWFALASSLPGISTNAQAVARATLRGAKRGRAEVIVPWHAKLLTRLHGVAPSTAATVAGWLTRVLPGADGTGEEVEGGRVEEQLRPARRRFLRSATALGRRGGRRARPGGASNAGRSAPNVGQAERVLSGATGGVLALWGLRLGGLAGIATGAAGVCLAARGATGRCPLYRSLGIGAANGRAARPTPERPAAATSGAGAGG